MNATDPRALIELVQERADSTDPLLLLQIAVTVAGETGEAADRLVEHYVAAARSGALSWTVIGERLGVSKQAARQRFAHRLEAGDLIGEAGQALAIAPRLTACLQ